VVGADPVLGVFRGLNHQQLIERFRELDARLTNAAAVESRERLARAIPRRGDVGDHPQWLTLARQVQMQRRQMPVRRVIEELPDVVRTLVPCLMMSPVSIAQYLPARHAIFDVVIFDEASQLPTWDAVGAIARGRQAIIAGDPKQLPPTSFFDRADEDEDGDDDVEDMQSVLEECIARSMPEMRLRWHYRSRHESLIAFSNERYYEGRLVTFPSPLTQDRAVRHVPVPLGVYDRGGRRTNRAEAEAVVADVRRRLEAAGDGRASIGIVTFNAEQQRLVQDHLDKLRADREDLERHFGGATDEPVFVKNLETVQGDERDVILFSIGYGPDAAGKVYMNFGPLNRKGGARRLNVAVTRARHELVVFATLRADQMALSPTTPDGVRDLKHFLEYASRGPAALVRTSGPPAREVETPFEEAVKVMIEARGWTVHPQVGVSGYRIDLGVVHPDAPGRYLAGVECDGATYHRSATARDRDRLRAKVLRDLGWSLVRVWSPDWWANPTREADAVHAQLQSLLEADRRPVPVPAAPPSTVSEPSVPKQYAGPVPLTPAPSPPPPAPTPVPTFASYEVADFRKAGIGTNADAFYEDWYRPTLRRMVALVIATEGPVYDATLVERVRAAHGFGRAGGRIREAVLGAVDTGVRRVVEGDDRTVYFGATVDPARVAFRRSDRSVRDVDAIPVMELAGLARALDVGNKFNDDAVIAMRDVLGVARVGAPMRERLLAAISLAKQVR
jgi:very-short-patch-repair endonuclease